MKTLKSLCVAAALFFTAVAVAQDGPLAFEEETHNFGNILKDIPALHEFAFTNISDKNIIITTVKTSCGCTVPDYPKMPIKPGESAVITAIYKGHYTGSFNKTLTVKTDSGSKTILRIKGKVVTEAALQTSGN